MYVKINSQKMYSFGTKTKWCSFVRADSERERKREGEK